MTQTLLFSEKFKNKIKKENETENQKDANVPNNVEF